MFVKIIIIIIIILTKTIGFQPFGLGPLIMPPVFFKTSPNCMYPPNLATLTVKETSKQELGFRRGKKMMRMYETSNIGQ